MKAVNSNHQLAVKSKAETFNRIMEATHGNKAFSWNTQACALLAAGMMQVPAASFHVLSRALPFFFATALVAETVAIDLAQLAVNCPSAQTLQDVVIEGAVCALSLLQA
jgi:hypothetical protein